MIRALHTPTKCKSGRGQTHSVPINLHSKVNYAVFDSVTTERLAFSIGLENFPVRQVGRHAHVFGVDNLHYR